MQIIKQKNHELDFCIKQAISVLSGGGIVAYPTETFYGLGAKFDCEPALTRLYEIKGRPKDKALPLIIGNAALLSAVTAEVPPQAEALIRRFWPGPLTIIFEALPAISPLVTAGTGTVAVRMPGGAFALELAKAAGFPITATSANISGFKPAADPYLLSGYFSNVLDLLIDGGKTTGGKPSTIVDTRGGKVVIRRQGVISEEEIFASLG